MRVIIVRKEIDPRVLFYIFAVLILIPWLAYQAITAVMFRNELHQVRSLMKLRQFNAAEEAMNPILAGYGMKRASLELLADLRLSKAEAGGTTSDWCSVIKAASLLKEHFWFFENDLNERLGRAYYFLGPPWFALSLESFSKIDQADLMTKEGLSVEKMLYEMHMNRSEFAQALNSVDRMCKAYPKDLNFRRMRAETLKAQGNPFAAQTELKNMVFNSEWNDEVKQAAMSLAKMQKDMLLTDESAFLYKYFEQKAPDDPDLLRDYGMFLYDQGKVTEGRRQWAKGLKNSERKKEFQRLLARMH